MKNASLIKELLGCYIEYINNLAFQYVHFSVVVESLAFRQPRKVMATFIEYLSHKGTVQRSSCVLPNSVGLLGSRGLDNPRSG